MNLRLSFAFIFLFAPLSLFAQQKSIKGKVQDLSGASMPYVNILLLKTQDSSLVKGAISDEDGKFSLENITQGKYFVSARMVGYETFNSEINIADTDLELPTISLSEAVLKMGEVVVMAAKPMIEMKNNAVVLNVAASPILTGGTAFDAITRAPGISTDQDGRISLKGRANVNVMIDGKMTYLSTEEIVRLLQNTPAANIESIEIMQNPPAKYDAAGNAGIINIKFKKAEDRGLVGNVGLNAGYGLYHKLSGNLNLNYRSPKVTLIATYSNNFAHSFQSLDINRKIPVGNDFSQFNQNAFMKNERSSHSFKVGFDYNLTDKTTIGTMFTGMINDFVDKNNNTTLLSQVNQNPYNRLQSNSYSTDPMTNLAFNTHLKHKFNNKGELTFDADFATWQSKGKQDIQNRFYKNEENKEVSEPLLLKMDNSKDIKIAAFKADYTQPIGENTSIETGLKSSFVKTDNELYATIPQNGEWIKDPTRSNTFNYQENIYAAYFTLNQKVKKFNFSAGLRSEYTYSDGFSQTLNQRNKREYLSLFPTLSINYAHSENHQFGLSYGRRIDRPNYSDLNPFVYLLDKYTYQKGNPFLNPQFTNTVGANYTFMGGLTFDLSYSNTQSALIEILEQDNATQATYQTTKNLNRIDNYALSISAPLPINKWWFLYANVNTFYSKVTSPSTQGDINNARFTAMLNINNTFTLPYNIKLELNAAYQSPLVYGIFEMAAQHQIDAGVSRKIGKWNVKLSVSDIFNTRKNQVIIKQGTIDAIISNKWETQVVRMNVSYQFGNNKMKISRGRSTSIGDESQRVK